MVPEINLLPNLERQRSTPMWLYILLIAIVALGLSFLIVQYVGAKGDLKTLTAEEQQKVEERDQLQAELSVLQGANQASLEQSVQYVENVSYAVSPLIDETQSLLPENTYLASYSFSEENVIIEVDFETMASISKYIENLLGSSYFSDAQLVSVSNFEIEAADSEEENTTAVYNEIPRYTTNITLNINKSYLATGGVN